MAEFKLNDAVDAVPVDTPSTQIIKAANKTVTVTDARSRVLTVRRMTALAKMRLFAMAGPELSKNEQWVGLAALASSVTAIDGDPVTANTVREVEFIVNRLDDEGLEAVAKVYQETFGITAKDDAIAAAKN
jgi:hypothetical protein